MIPSTQDKSSEDSTQVNELNYSKTTLKAVQGEEGFPLQTVVDLADDIAGIVGKFNKGFQQKYCMLKLNALTYLQMLDELAGNIVGVAIDVANRIVNCVGSSIVGAINRVMGSIFGILDAIQNFIDAVDILLNKLDQIIKDLIRKGIEAFRKFLQQDDCEYVLAEMSQCAVSKLIGSNKLEEKANKLINKMYQTEDSINEVIVKEIANDTSSLSNYIEKQSFMANKAAIQLNNLDF